MEIIRTDSSDEAFNNLIKELDNDLRSRYEDLQNVYDRYNKVQHLSTVILVYQNGAAVGCGCFKPFDEETVEIKRMYTKPGYRGQGIAASILQALEAWAGELNYKSAVLETGRKQPEAIGLYKKLGYELIPNYGQYSGMDTSICMKKSLKKNNAS